MSEMLPVRIEAAGPAWWQIKVVDARTGDLLPVKRGFTIDVPDDGGPITANLSLIVSELELPEVLVESLKKGEWEC